MRQLLDRRSNPEVIQKRGSEITGHVLEPDLEITSGWPVIR
jgi:hypothetical protein